MEISLNILMLSAYLLIQNVCGLQQGMRKCAQRVYIYCLHYCMPGHQKGPTRVFLPMYMIVVNFEPGAPLPIHGPQSGEITWAQHWTLIEILAYGCMGIVGSIKIPSTMTCVHLIGPHHTPQQLFGHKRAPLVALNYNMAPQNTAYTTLLMFSLSSNLCYEQIVATAVK